MLAPQQTNVQMQMQGQPFQQPQFYRYTNYPQVQRYSLLQQNFGVPVQPMLQQQGTNGTSLQSSTAQYTFAPSPHHLESPTCKLLLLSVAFLLLCVLFAPAMRYYVVTSHAMSTKVVFSVLRILCFLQHPVFAMAACINYELVHSSPV